jgi:peptidoglycan/xylan/chitin deacetylase (PgdA/CDA1 family)
MERKKYYVNRSYAHMMSVLFPSVMCTTDSPHLHVTFDDGPHLHATPEVLRILSSYHIAATFFCLGKNVVQYPSLVESILANGHRIGSHGFSHTTGYCSSSAAIERDILAANDALQNVTGLQPTLYRPPYGACSPAYLRVIRRQSLRMVLWSVDTRDFSYSPDRLSRSYRHALATPGDIFLLHDNERTTGHVSQTLPILLEALLSHHFTFSPRPL